ncbi:unnamed protein product [marine sediment metagenome]|uniref:Uncharacterized protein n=1 Tax=marine sediment metagenome TaxID=412755 RepID=X0V206_9ZZZZ
MCDTEGVYRKLSTAKKTARILSVGLFCGAGFYKRREKKIQRKEKRYLSLAIGENYINKMFLFFNILFMDVFTYRLTAKNPIKIVTVKGR